MDAFSSCPSFQYTLYGEDVHDTLYLSAIEPLSFSSPGCSREHHHTGSLAPIVGNDTLNSQCFGVKGMCQKILKSFLLRL